MAEVSDETVRSISTPDTVESRLGTLEFNDGAPSEATAALLYDHLDFIHGVQAFIGAYPGASVVAIRRGFHSIGAEDNTMVAFSELMDSASLFLTANCDTFYFVGFVDLSDGPMVIDVPALEAPSGILGTIDDMWFRWVTDFGVPGPDRGEGGRYLLVGPGYRRSATGQRLPRGPLPHHSRARAWAGRSWSTTTPVSRPTRSARASGSRSTCPELRAPRSPPISPARRPSVGHLRLGETTLHRSVRDVVQHHPPERLRLLGHDQRADPTGTTVRQRPRAAGHARPPRDRPRQAVQARRAHAQGPRRRGGRRQRDRPHSHLRVPTRGGLRLLPGIELVQHAVGRRLRVPRSASPDHRRWRRAGSRAMAPAS